MMFARRHARQRPADDWRIPGDLPSADAPLMIVLDRLRTAARQREAAAAILIDDLHRIHARVDMLLEGSNNLVKRQAMTEFVEALTNLEAGNRVLHAAVNDLRHYTNMLDVGLPTAGRSRPEATQPPPDEPSDEQGIAEDARP